MRDVGVDDDARLPAPAAAPASTPTAAACALPPAARRCRRSSRAVLGRRGWRWRDRIALLRVAAGWRRAASAARRARPSPSCGARCRRACARDLIEPLCVAALNTPADAGERQRLPARAARRARSPAAARPTCCCRARRSSDAAARAGARLARAGTARRSGWRIASSALERRRRPAGASTATPFDRVVVAASAVEAARLVRAARAAPGRRRAAALRYEPIVTVYARSAGCAPARADARAARRRRPRRRSSSSTAASSAAPAGLLAFVISGAAAWVERGIAATEQATLAQARAALARHLRGPLEIAAHDRREAGDLPLHAAARPAARWPIAPGPARCRRLRRRPLPGHARRRGAQRRRRGTRRCCLALRLGRESAPCERARIRTITIQVLERAFALLDLLASHQEPVSLKEISEQSGPAPVDRAPHPQRPDDRPLRRPARGRQLPPRHAPARARQPGQGAARRARRRAGADARAAQADAPAGQPVDAPGRRDRLHRAHLQRALGHAGRARHRRPRAAAPHLGRQAVPGARRRRSACAPTRRAPAWPATPATASPSCRARARARRKVAPVRHRARRRGARARRALHGRRHLDDQGKLVAGLSISAPADRLEEGWLERLQATAAQISAALGHRG